MILRGWLSQVLRLQSTTKSDALTADSRLMRRVPTRRMPQAFATLGVGSEKVDARVVVAGRRDVVRCRGPLRARRAASAGVVDAVACALRQRARRDRSPLVRAVHLARQLRRSQSDDAGRTRQRRRRRAAFDQDRRHRRGRVSAVKTPASASVGHRDRASGSSCGTGT